MDEGAGDISIALVRKSFSDSFVPIAGFYIQIPGTFSMLVKYER